MNPESMFIVTVPSGFELEAKKEIEKLLPGSKVRSTFFKGNLIVKAPYPEKQVVAKLRNAETLYVGHVYPVEEKIKISAEKESIAKLYLPLKGKLGPQDSFAVHCRRRGTHNFSSGDVEKEIGNLLREATGAAVNLKTPKKTVVLQIFQNQAFVGVTDTENILVKNVGVQRKYAKGERPITRAEHKIKEAIEAFNLKIGRNWDVLDLGAAPGGWTKVLSSLARTVVAVDPADLDARVAELPNVVHLRCRAEEVPDDIGCFDLVTNDMNLDPSESAKIMVQLADHVREGGVAIMTVKFVTRNRKKHLTEAIETLKAAYKNFKVKRLRHNRYETTVFMQKI